MSTRLAAFHLTLVARHFDETIASDVQTRINAQNAVRHGQAAQALDAPQSGTDTATGALARQRKCLCFGRHN
jgi:hypothetical protein